MIPYHESMYPDDITLKRAVHVTGPQGGTKRTYPEAGEDFRARVQSKDVNRVDAQGRVYTTTVWRITTPVDIAAEAGDRIEYLGRTLVPEGRTLPKGLGNVAWLTQCQETRS